MHVQPTTEVGPGPIWYGTCAGRMSATCDTPPNMRQGHLVNGSRMQPHDCQICRSTQPSLLLLSWWTAAACVAHRHHVKHAGMEVQGSGRLHTQEERQQGSKHPQARTSTLTSPTHAMLPNANELCTYPNDPRSGPPGPQTPHMSN